MQKLRQWLTDRPSSKVQPSGVSAEEAAKQETEAARQTRLRAAAAQRRRQQQGTHANGASADPKTPPNLLAARLTGRSPGLSPTSPVASSPYSIDSGGQVWEWTPPVENLSTPGSGVPVDVGFQSANGAAVHADDVVSNGSGADVDLCNDQSEIVARQRLAAQYAASQSELRKGLFPIPTSDTKLPQTPSEQFKGNIEQLIAQLEDYDPYDLEEGGKQIHDARCEAAAVLKKFLQDNETETNISFLSGELESIKQCHPIAFTAIQEQPAVSEVEAFWGLTPSPSRAQQHLLKIATPVGGSSSLSSATLSVRPTPIATPVGNSSSRRHSMVSTSAPPPVAGRRPLPTAPNTVGGTPSDRADSVPPLARPKPTEQEEADADAATTTTGVTSRYSAYLHHSYAGSAAPDTSSSTRRTLPSALLYDSSDTDQRDEREGSPPPVGDHDSRQITLPATLPGIPNTADSHGSAESKASVRVRRGRRRRWRPAFETQTQGEDLQEEVVNASRQVIRGFYAEKIILAEPDSMGRANIQRKLTTLQSKTGQADAWTQVDCNREFLHFAHQSRELDVEPCAYDRICFDEFSGLSAKRLKLGQRKMRMARVLFEEMLDYLERDGVVASDVNPFNAQGDELQKAYCKALVALNDAKMEVDFEQWKLDWFVTPLSQTKAEPEKKAVSQQHVFVTFKRAFVLVANKELHRIDPHLLDDKQPAFKAITVPQRGFFSLPVVKQLATFFVTLFCLSQAATDAKTKAIREVRDTAWRSRSHEQLAGPVGYALSPKVIQKRRRASIGSDSGNHFKNLYAMYRCQLPPERQITLDEQVQFGRADRLIVS